MPDIFILTDAPDSATSSLALFSSVEMKRAILADGLEPDEAIRLAGIGSTQVEVLFTADPEPARSQLTHPDTILCPLTLNLPEWLQFEGRTVFDACANTFALRQRVTNWDYAVGNGRYWQPIVLTMKGALFAEGIASSDHEQTPYLQPLHLGDAKRQPLYALGQRLLQVLAALPGVYLMQFGMDEQQVWFDRLIPFPDAPAIASVGRQTPDLFECHWRCLTQQPIRDLSIIR
jgi:hypothetical protein